MKLENVLKELQSIQTDLFIRYAEASLEIHPYRDANFNFIFAYVFNDNAVIHGFDPKGKPTEYHVLNIPFLEYDNAEITSNKFKKIKMFINHKGEWTE